MNIQEFAKIHNAEFPEFPIEFWELYGQLIAHPVNRRIPFEKNPQDLVKIVELDRIRYNLQDIIKTPYNLLPLSRKQLKRYQVADETQPVSILIFLYMINPDTVRIILQDWKAWFLLDIGPESLWNLAKSYGYSDKKTFETWYIYSLPFRYLDGTIAVRSTDNFPQYEYKFRGGIPSAYTIDELFERDLTKFEYVGPELHFDVLAEIATKSAGALLNFAQTNSTFAYFASLESTWKNMLSRNFPADFDWNRQRLPVFFRKWRDYYLWLNKFTKVIKLDEALHKKQLEDVFVERVLSFYPGETLKEKYDYVIQNNIRTPLTKIFFEENPLYYTAEQMETFPAVSLDERYHLPLSLSSNVYVAPEYDQTYRTYQLLSYAGRYDKAMKMFIEKTGYYEDIESDIFLEPPRDSKSGKLIGKGHFF